MQVVWGVNGVKGQVEGAEEPQTGVAGVGRAVAADRDDGVWPFVAVAQVLHRRHCDGVSCAC